MIIVVFILFVVAVAGALAYALAANPKAGEIGRIAFAFALLVILLSLKDIVALVR